jgi:hypothetical protein
VVFLHAIEERAARESKKLSGVRAVSAVAVECKLDQGALDSDEIDSDRRNDDTRGGARGVRPLNGNRCMLVGNCGPSHDWRESK